MSSRKLRVLLTNDDGPPGPESPYIYGLWKHLALDLGWDVKVVVPSSQKSWIGKAYQIKDIINGRFYYPVDPNGAGDISEKSRPLKDGETTEWILLDGTPATCANIGLHNLYHGEIDLVISGPNLGRNTSSAFSMSSGTLGAALSSSLSLTRSIALSYGTMTNKPTADLFMPAHRLSGHIISHLLDNWGADAQGLRSACEVDLYSINVPMVPALLQEPGLPIAWTRIWRNNYGRLFQAHTPAGAQSASPPAAGPDAPRAAADPQPDGKKEPDPKEVGALVFRFAPEMKQLVNPPEASLPVGSDAWAIHKGYVSVTPLRASFAEPPGEGHELARLCGEGQERFLKLKL